MNNDTEDAFLHYYRDGNGNGDGDGDDIGALSSTDIHRVLASAFGQYIAFQVFRIILPLMVFIFCFWCHDNTRRRAVEGGGGIGHSRELTQEQIAAREESRKQMLSETLVFKTVVEADVENQAPTQSDVPKGDIFVPKTGAPRRGSSRSLGAAAAETFDDERPICSICMVEYEPGETVCWSPNPQCTHAFHWECMAQWLMMHDECPQCRNDYLNKNPPPPVADWSAGGDSRAAAQTLPTTLTMASSTSSRSVSPNEEPMGSLTVADGGGGHDVSSNVPSHGVTSGLEGVGDDRSYDDRLSMP